MAESLTREFGKGFDDRNLRNMRAFYQAFPIWHAVRTELSWTHYRTLLRVSNQDAREWYVNEAALQNWSARALDRQIGTLYFERLLLSGDKVSVTAEADTNIAELQQTPREFVRDPVMLEFLGLPGTGKLLESKLEQALMDKLQAFLMELGKGFAFVARQQRISTETQDFYVDLVFYNYLLKCFVLIDLKTGKLTHQTSVRWTCMCECMTTSNEAMVTTQPSAFCCVNTKINQWCATRCSMKVNKCLRPGTGWCYHPKKSFERKLSVNEMLLKLHSQRRT